ncbi:MAG: hypothetical protein JXR94_07775 [Candidatus Hydrogenedentes bacterium]|nr:hypothetical protein [Candidatus Hydrogenedentota bacterium]
MHRKRMAWLVILAASASWTAVCAEGGADMGWHVGEDNGRLVVQRAGDDTIWQGEPLAEIAFWDAAGAEQSGPVAPAAGWTLEQGPVAGGCAVTCRQVDTGFALRIVLTMSDDVLTVSVPADGIAENGEARLKSLRLLPRFGAAHEGDDGYLVIPQQSGALCRFRDKAPGEHWVPVYQSICSCPMPVFGSIRGTSGLAAVVTSGQFDARLCISVNHGPEHEYAIDPGFALRSFREETRLADDVTVEYHVLPAVEATWAGVGKRYRQYNFAHRGIRTIRERAARSPELAYAAQSIEVRIRLGVKPVPYEIVEQTPENEPPIRVFCTFARVRDIVDEFHRQGIERAEFCLVGWNRGGHDGRYPQIFPVEPALGGEEELRATIQHAQSLGYQIVAHDCYYGAYRISEDWSEDYIRKKADGTMEKGGAWGGGQSYNICLTQAHDLFAQRDMPRTRALGFRGLHYSDVISMIGPRPCYDPRHPQTRHQDAEAATRILALAREQFGGAQSEGSLDFAASALDRVLYVDCDKWAPLAKKPYVDERVPLYEVVYHGVLLYNLSTEGVNSQPGEPGYLRNIEYGGMPVAYFYGHFLLDESKNWLGKRDYRYDDKDTLTQIATQLRGVYDDVARLSHLQLEFLEGHRQVAENVFETVYSNGERVIVNHGESAYALPAGGAVPPHAYRLVTD